MARKTIKKKKKKKKSVILDFCVENPMEGGYYKEAFPDMDEYGGCTSMEWWTNSKTT